MNVIGGLKFASELGANRLGKDQGDSSSQKTAAVEPTRRPLARERSRSRAHRTMRLAWSHSLENSRVLFGAVDRDPTRGVDA